MLTDRPLQRNALERFLAIFADVQPGEGLTALLFMMNVFTLLTAYYIIKPVREALILSGSGAEIKSYAGAAQAMLLVLIVPIYGVVASRMNRIRLINGMTAFFISNLLIFFVLGRAHVPLGIVFFLWVGLFNLLLPAQFWALANDVYTQEQGRRLFAIVGIGSSLGAILGAKVAGWLFEPVGAYAMMLVSAGLLVICMGLTNWIHHREKRAAMTSGSLQAETVDRPIGGTGAFQLVFRYRYLFLIAILVLTSNLVNTTGEFILGKAVTLHAATSVASAANPALTKEAYIGKFYADFFFWVNLAGAALQLFVVSRIMKYLGIGSALFFLPLIALGSYGLLALMPVLSLIRIGKIFENSTDYSIQNTARHALFLRTNREAKYKAKSAIDSFFWRAGDGLSALLVFIGTQLAFDLRSFALVNLVLVVLWLGLVIGINRIRDEQASSTRPLAA